MRWPSCSQRSGTGGPARQPSRSAPGAQGRRDWRPSGSSGSSLGLRRRGRREGAARPVRRSAARLSPDPCRGPCAPGAEGPRGPAPEAERWAPFACTGTSYGFTCAAVRTPVNSDLCTPTLRELGGGGLLPTLGDKNEFATFALGSRLKKNDRQSLGRLIIYKYS